MQVRRFRFGGWPDEWCELRACEGAADVTELRSWVAERRGEVLAIDCETNALDPFEPGFRTRTVQVSDGLTSWMAPVWSDDGWFTLGEQLGLMVRDHPRWVAHFAENDERFLCRGMGLGWDPVRWSDPEPHFWDTQVPLAVYDPRTVTTHSRKPGERIHPAVPRPKGLKPTTSRLLTPALAEAEDALHARFRELAPKGYRGGGERTRAWGFANVPLDDPAFMLYAMLDPLATARLYRLLRRALEDRGQWPRTEAALAEQWVVDGATYRGMRVDAPYARWLDGELAAECARLRPVLAPAGIGESGQGPAVGRAFNGLGVESPKRSEDGAESWDKDALGAVAERAEGWLADYAAGRHPEDPALLERVARVAQLAAAVRQTRRASKYRGTWVRPMLWAVDRADGASHASMRAVGTVTTRMTCQKTPTAGPLHSAPKREETRLRACYRAERGWAFVSADLKQGEPYVMAALSGDPDYLAHLAGGDINGRLAAELYGPAYLPEEGKAAGTKSYAMRQACKFAWLAACYGAADRKVDALLGLPGSGSLARWRAMYPRFWAYADECNQQRAVRLDSGHVVPLWDRVWATEAGELYDTGRPSRLGLNAATQGTQSDVLRVAIHRHRSAGWHWALRFFLHDELVGCVPAWMAEPYREFLERAMTVSYRGVVISAEAEVCGPTWFPQVGGFDAADLAAIDDEEAEQ